MTYLEQLMTYRDQNKKIALIGFGVEIKTFLVWLINTIEFPAENIYISDTRGTISIPEEINKKDAETLISQSYSGFSYLQVLQEDVELVFKAPGMWSLKPELVEFREKHGADSIQSCLVYFIEKFKEHIIGITGTKGKTTTSTLTTHILQDFPISQGRTISSQYCGNTSNISPYSFWDTPVDDSTVFVVELSSYQLQDVAYCKISPHISIITNLLIDHQDQHKSPQEYWRAKEHIFLHQTSQDFFYFSSQAYKRLSPNQGYSIDEAQARDASLTVHSPLRGAHNEMNLALALHAIHTVIDPDSSFNVFLESHGEYITQKLSSYSQPSLRQEIIRTITLNNKQTVRFINDGAGSEAAAVAAAIKAFVSDKEWVWLFMNGRDKGSDTSILHETLKTAKDHILKKTVSGAVGNRFVFEGGANESSKTLAHSLPSDESLSKTIKKWSENNPGEGNSLNIIFSPGGSSFDEYKNYVERGQAWSQWVQSIDISED